MQTTWLKAQKEMGSLWNLGKRYRELFSPPINKLFYWILSRFIATDFADFLEFLKRVAPATYCPTYAGTFSQQAGRSSPADM